MSSLSAGTDPPAPEAAASQSIVVRLADPSGVGEARRAVATLAARAGVGAGGISDLSIIVNELASNVVRHGGGGQLLVRQLQHDGRPGIEVLCVDSGRGMKDLAGCFRDGFSTVGTMGTGLGAARRIAHAFDIFSAPGLGTVVVARIWAGGAPPAPAIQLGAVAAAVAGERECGDAWALTTDGARAYLLLADGLGHGVGAAEAARLAVRLFGQQRDRRPAQVLDVLHRGLRSTRGAAVALAEIDLASAQVHFAGIGNIAGRIVTEDATRSLVSHNGIVGHQSARMHEFTYPFPPDATIIMHSDGLTSHWKHESYAGFLRRDPAIAAGLLYRDHARGRDDASVVVFRPRALESRSGPV